MDRRELFTLGRNALLGAALAPKPTPSEIAGFLLRSPDIEPKAAGPVQMTDAKCIQGNCDVVSNNKGKIFAAAIQYPTQDVEVWKYDLITTEKAVPTYFPLAGPNNHREAFKLITDGKDGIFAFGNTRNYDPHRNNIQVRAEGYSLKNGIWSRDWNWMTTTDGGFLPCASRAHAAFRNNDETWAVWMEDYFYNSRPGPGKQPGYYTENKILLLRKDGWLEGSASVDSPAGHTMFPTMAEGNGHILSAFVVAKEPGAKRNLFLQTFSTQDLSTQSQHATEVIVTEDSKQIDVVMPTIVYNTITKKFDIAITGIDENQRFMVLSLSVPPITQEEKITLPAIALSDPDTEYADNPRITYNDGQTYVTFHTRVESSDKEGSVVKYNNYLDKQAKQPTNTKSLPSPLDQHEFIGDLPVSKTGLSTATEGVALISLLTFQRQEIPGSGQFLNNHQMCPLPSEPPRLTSRFLAPKNVFITGNGPAPDSPYSQLFGYRPPSAMMPKEDKKPLPNSP